MRLAHTPFPLLLAGCLGPKGADDTAVNDHWPQAVIVAPGPHTIVNEGDEVVFEAVVTDVETAPADLGLYWFSDMSGELGAPTADADGRTSVTSSSLLPFDQTIALFATDSAGQIATAFLDITVNALPGAPTVTLGPAGATTDDPLVAEVSGAEDPDGHTVQLHYAWYRDGLRSSASDGATFPSSQTRRGQHIRVVVTPADAYGEGPSSEAELTVANAAPSITTVSISPDPAHTADALTCSWDGWHDPDDDGDQSTLSWSVDGVVVGTEPTLRDAFGWRERVSCTVTPFDGLDAGEPVSATVEIESAEIDLSAAHARLLGEGSEADAGLGLCFAGDVDGDGLDDLLIGAPEQHQPSTDSGAAYLLLGPISGEHPLQTAHAVLAGESQRDKAGRGVAGPGDIDGDGFDDLLIGAENAGIDEQGTAYLVYGPVTGSLSLASADLRFIGQEEGDLAGWAVSGIGDQDGDGLPELAIAAPYASRALGRVHVVSSEVQVAMSLADADGVFEGDDEGDAVGWSLADPGDVDGDGIGDLLIGAGLEDGYAEGSGAAYLVLGPISGFRTAVVADARVSLHHQGAMVGYSVSSAGDADGDGLPDLLVGAHGLDTTVEDVGGAYLVPGTTRGELDLVDAEATITGVGEDDHAGRAVAGGGDVDGDGYDDLLVGVYGGSGSTWPEGAACLFTGPMSGTHTIEDAALQLVGEISQDQAGLGLSMSGDADGDGLADLLIGASNADGGGYRAGMAYLLYGGLLEGMR